MLLEKFSNKYGLIALRVFIANKLINNWIRHYLSCEIHSLPLNQIKWMNYVLYTMRIGIEHKIYQFHSTIIYK